MIIDCHMHLKGGDIERTEFCPANIVKVMDEAGIDRAIVFAICETTEDSINRTKRALNLFPERFIGFVYAIPSFEQNVLEKIKKAVDEGFCGIKLHGGETRLSPWIVDSLFEFAQENKLPILLDPVGDFSNVERLTREFRGVNLICAHLGNMLEPDTKRIISFAKERENLYLDTSYVRMTQYIRRAIEVAGPNKVIFGSDGPDVNVKVELFKVKSLGLKREDEDLVLYKNILRLIGDR